MSRTGAKLLLLAVFAARGTSFLYSKLLLADMSPMSVLAVRFLLAFLILVIVFPGKLFRCDRKSLTGGIILGVLYTVCMAFEMFALRLIDTGTVSLVENMAIVLVPLIAAVLTRTLPGRKTLLCAVLAVTGVGFLSMTQRGAGSGTGILFTFLSAVIYASCILTTERVSRDADPIAVGIVQLGTMGALSLIFALLSGNFGVPHTGTQWIMMLMLVLLCSSFGFAFQPVGQKYVPAETAAVFTVVNPLTASIMGIAVAGEGTEAPKMIGISLVLLALMLYNFRFRPKPKKLHIA